MSLLDVGLYISGFWAILHLLKAFYQRRKSATNTTGLLGQRPLTKSASSDVQFQTCYIRLDTRKFNDAQDKLTAWFVRSPSWKYAATIFYDIGSLCSLIGMLLAQALLLWSIYFLVRSIIGTGEPVVSEPSLATPLHRRDWEDASLATRDDALLSHANESPVSLLVSCHISHVPLQVSALCSFFRIHTLVFVRRYPVLQYQSPISSRYFSCCSSLKVCMKQGMQSLPQCKHPLIIQHQFS